MKRSHAVETANGTLVGQVSQDTGMRTFRGIPYALPPTGDRRFAPPAPLAPWRGEKLATEFAKACTQPPAVDAFVWSREPFDASEDCLYLNIWAPPEQRAARPVMVWFHGGAHTTGFAHAAIFDGTSLADQGVIVVTVNYRLGVLGFLSHPAFAAGNSHGSTGNWGLHDKIAALHWVKQNIAAFGGDPNNVTIFGQSAGSQSVCALMASSKAQGLFHKAIGQSAACVLPDPDKDVNGHVRGDALARSVLGEQQPVALEALRAVPVQQLLQAQETTGWANKSRITVDGDILTEHPSKTFLNGQQTNVPLVVGWLGNEGEELFPLPADMTAATFHERLQRHFGHGADELAGLYAEELAASPPLAWRTIMIDQFMGLAMRTWADRQRSLAPTYLYHFSHVPPAFKLYSPSAPELDLPGGPRSAGAYHSGDLAFVFGTTRSVGTGWIEEDHTLSDHIVRYWTNFAKTGNPNDEALPNWATYTSDARQTLQLDTVVRTVNGVQNAKLDALERYGLGR